MDAIPAEERLFSLVLALVASEHGLTKADILSTVQGYRQRYRRGDDNATLERQFERDKDDIRDLGVPLETIEAPDDPGNNQQLRYRIAKGAYDLPQDVSFTPEETTLLGLAAEVWREGSLSSESRRALLKLRSLGVEVDDRAIGYAPRVRVREPAFDGLSEAIDRTLAVRFAYLKPGEAAATTRLVEPRALVKYESRWHLIAFDRDRRAPRTFLLSRIVGDVTRTRTVFTPPEGDPAAEALEALEGIFAAGAAVVDVIRGSDAERRLETRVLDGLPEASAIDVDESGPRRLRIGSTDQALLADEIASYGPEARVISPDSLRSAVIERLTRVLADHRGPVPSGAEI
ncbi:MAG: WYL domain-containing protein [Naasia sp.]